MNRHDAAYVHALEDRIEAMEQQQLVLTRELRERKAQRPEEQTAIERIRASNAEREAREGKRVPFVGMQPVRRGR